MPFCPKCRYEYVDGIGECPDCGARLVEKLDEEESTEGMEEESTESVKKEANQSIKEPFTTSIKFIPLKDIPSYIPAEILRRALDEAWIPSLLSGSTIWVPEEDKEKVKEIADQMLDHI